MTLQIALLVFASALLHPFWNALVKTALSPDRSYLGLASVMSLLGLAHSLAAGADLWAAWQAWPLLALSYGGQALYGFALVATLKRGDLSAYYPIVRASPLFIVIVGFLLLGERYPPALLLGVALVVAGGFALQYRPQARLLSDPVTLTFALLAMSGTGIYSLADGALMRNVAPSVVLFWVEGAFAATYAFYLHRRVPSAPAPDAPPRSAAARLAGLLLPGALAYSSYWLILQAYAFGGNVAAVTAVRQASIIVSVLIGGYLLREGALARRLTGAGVLTLGIVVIVTMR